MRSAAYTPCVLRWQRDGLCFEARSCVPALVRAHAATLRRWYNAQENVSMMGGSGTMTDDDVVSFYRELGEEGGVGMLAFVDDELVGDMDLRGFEQTGGERVAEFAIMIGDDARKSRGLGRTFAAMLHVHAFRDLGVARLYVPPREENTRVHALNDWLGYARDDSPRAASYADEAGCVTSSLSAAAFAERHEAAWRDVVASPDGEADAGGAP